MRFSIIVLLLLAGTVGPSFGAGESMHAAREPAFLLLESKIPLGAVRGRIDHMAVDLKRRRLFVAELGNNTVGVVDLANRTVARTITGLKEPQGVGYVPATDTLYVANAGDGSVRLFRGSDYSAIGRIDLGDDADNVRVDTAANRVFIGYGRGALAVIDASSHRKIGAVRLKAHPEGFQLDDGAGRIFVNLPDSRSIAVIDRTSQRVAANWRITGLAANFPMDLDEAHNHVLVAFRRPSKLGVFSMRDGSLVATTPICGNADDVFVDTKRQRAYVSCGNGFLDVLETQGAAYRRIGHLPTAPGTRTSLFISQLDLLFLAVRASARQQPEIWVFRPAP